MTISYITTIPLLKRAKTPNQMNVHLMYADIKQPEGGTATLFQLC